MASTYLTKNLSTATDLKTWTWSAWIKRSKLSTEQGLFSGDAASTYTTSFFFDTSDRLQYKDVSAGSTRQQLITNRVFRDTSSWYNIQIVYNSTEGASSNRLKFYVNGSQETSFSTSTYPSSNETVQINSSDPTGIGKQPQSTSNNFDGSMSHIHFIDGTAYDASYFGSTDSVTGHWKINTSPSVTYGTNGFFILKDGNSVTDQSGNTNNFTVSGGTLTNTEDSPSNVFATWNPLGNSNGGLLPTFSNGNTTSDNASGTTYSNSKSTFGVSKGKYYCEAKVSLSSAQGWFGLAPDDDYAEVANTYLYENSGTFGGSAYGNAYVTNDILQLAFDANTGTVWFGINGTWQNSATQTEIENGTTANSAVTGLDVTKYWHIANKGFSSAIYYANFGNGYFGTTAVASAGTNASGNGIFEYDVPTGFTALSTKGLNL